MTPEPKKKRPKTGGRKKGSLNKKTRDMRTFVSAFVDKRLNTLDSDWKKLKAFERVQMLEKFMRFSLPTLQSINITEDFGKKWETMDDNQKKEFANIVIDLWSTQQSKNTNS